MLSKLAGLAQTFQFRSAISRSEAPIVFPGGSLWEIADPKGLRQPPWAFHMFMANPQRKRRGYLYSGRR